MAEGFSEPRQGLKGEDSPTGTFGKDSTHYGGDPGGLGAVSVVLLRDNEYLLPTSVLCENSPVIRNAVSKQRGDTIPRIQIKGVDDKTFEVLVEYMRSGDTKVNVQNVIDVYHAAQSLQITPLEMHCWSSVFDRDPKERSLPAWVAAKKLKMGKEEKQLLKFITHNFDDIASSKSFMELECDQVKEILRSDVIKAENELELYKFAMKWIHHDCKERQKFASSLMEVIRFQDMTPAQVENLKQYPVCPEVQKAFDISNRIPQPGQKRPDKGRDYGAGSKPAVPVTPQPKAATPATPATQTTPATQATQATPIAPATAPAPVLVPASSSQPPVEKTVLVEKVPAATPPVVPTKVERKTDEKKAEPKKDETKDTKQSLLLSSAPPKGADSKEKIKGADDKDKKKLDSKDKDDKDKKKTDSKDKVDKDKEKPDSKLNVKGYKKDKTKTEKKDKKERKDKKDKKDRRDKKDKSVKSEDTSAKSETKSDVLSSSTAAPTLSEPSPASKSLPSDSQVAIDKSKDKKDKDKKKDKGKQKKDKDKKGKDKKEQAKKKRGFCPWSSRSGKSSKSQSKELSKKGGKKEKGKNKKSKEGGKKGKGKDAASKETVARTESKSTEAGKKKKSKSKEKKDKKSASKESSGKSKSRESKEKSSKEGKKETARKPKKEKKASKEKKGSETKAGGGGKKKESTKPSAKSRRQDKLHHSEKSPSSSRDAKSSSKSSKSSSAPVPGRKLASHRKSDTGVQKTLDSGGAKSHRKTHSANRMSRRSSDTSTLGKNLLRTERHKRNLSKVPHRARSDTVHSSDFSLKALEHDSFAGEEMVVAVLGGLAVDSKGANRESNAIVKYVPRESKWTFSGKLPSKRYGHLAAVTKGCLYIVGGFEVSRDKCHIPTGTCNRYSFSKGCWDKVASLKYPRCHHGVTVVLGQIYAVGGQSVESLFMDSVEAYDPGSDKWSPLTPLCCARMAANAIEFKDQMYVVGGLMVVPGHKRKVCIVPDTMCFNPQTDTWHHRAALPLPMCNSSLVVHNDRLFAFGGLVRTVTQDKSQPLTPIGDVLEYTPGTDTWVLLTSMPTPCHSSCLASLGDDIYVLGGQLEDDAATATKASYRYNPSTDRWLALPPLPSRLSQSCAVALRSHVFE